MQISAPAFNTSEIMFTPKIPEGVGNKLIKVGAAVALFFIGKKMLANKAQDSADNQVDTNPAAGQARALNAAMNPSGFNWMRSFDTTNTDAIYSIAPQITKLDDVKDFYKSQTKGRILYDDLTDELGADGFNKFLALASHGKVGDKKYSTNRTDIPANMWIVTSADANVRKTPKKESAYLPGNNIVKTVNKGKSIGVTTGKYTYDESSDVTFIEFWTVDAKTTNKHYFYVAKSQVELLTKAQKDEREKSGKLPFEMLAGLSGATDNHRTQIVTIRPTTIYTEDLKALRTIRARLIVGFPLLTLKSDKGSFTKVETVEGLIRWVKTEDTTEQQRK